jgi:uncharacterized membrane protein
MMQDLGAAFQPWVEAGTTAIEAIAVALIIGYILVATMVWLIRSLIARRVTSLGYQQFRANLGRAMLLGLEILIAADVVRTVALEPTMRNFEALGMLVVVRTFLSWSIVLEIEGRWPWQPRPASAEGSP